MYSYTLYEKKIVSDLEFPYLVRDMGDGPADILIEAGEIPEEIQEQAAMKVCDFGSDRSWIRNSATWLIAEHGNRITYKLRENGTVMKLRNYITGFGISMLALQRGELPIHCSAVSRSGSTVLIAGKSGSGKSTLTASFLEAGYSLVADDIAMIEVMPGGQVIARPAFPYQKLCRDAALKKGYNLDELIYINESKDKFLVPYRGNFSLKAIPVQALLYLTINDGGPVDITPVQGLDKFYICLQNLFMANLLGAKRYEPHLGQKALHMAAGISVYMAQRPVLGDTLGELSRLCLNAVLPPNGSAAL